MENQQYAGFWIRAFALIIDNIVFGIILAIPVFMLGAGAEAAALSEGIPTSFVALYILLIVAILALWVYKGATPGKMLTKTKIVDATTGDNLSWGKAILRLLGYIPSQLIFFLGFIWVAFDAKKQGWHDKIAGSVVIKDD